MENQRRDQHDVQRHENRQDQRPCETPHGIEPPVRRTGAQYLPRPATTVVDRQASEIDQWEDGKQCETQRPGDDDVPPKLRERLV